MYRWILSTVVAGASLANRRTPLDWIQSFLAFGPFEHMDAPCPWSSFPVNPTHRRHRVFRKQFVEEIRGGSASLGSCFQIAQLQVDPSFQVLTSVVELIDEQVTELKHLLLNLLLRSPLQVLNNMFHGQGLLLQESSHLGIASAHASELLRPDGFM